MNDDKTIRVNQPDPDATVRPGQNIISADSDKTVRANDSVLSADATVRADSQIISASQGFIAALGSEPKEDADEITLNNKTYRKVKTISESTGEAQVYLLAHGGEKCVLKLYYPSIKPKDELIKKMRSFQHPDILKVLDYGYYQNRFFELMEFAAGGTLDQYQPLKDAKRIRDIVAETANALEFCHKNSIVHRDLKPGNLFFKNANGTDILLGDFGISSIVEDDELGQITGQARTQVYAAPELYKSVNGKALVRKELDYYALGITLIVLWSGENPFKGLNEMETMILKDRGKVMLPNDMPDDLKTLVKGLTVVNIEKRWGFNEIQKWLRGETVTVFAEADASAYKPFTFDQQAGLVANTPEELARLLQEDPETGKRYLYRGRITKWLEEANDSKTAVVVEELYEKLYPKDEDAGLQAAIYILDPAMPYKAIDGTKCRDLNEIAAVLEKNLDDYQEALKKRNNPFYIYLETHGLAKEANKFRKYYKNEMEHLAILHIIYTLKPGAEFQFDENKFAASPEAIVQYMIKDQKRGTEIIFDAELETWLDYNAPDIAGKITKIREDFSDDEKSGFAVAIYTLNPDMPYVAPDQKHYKSKKELAQALMNNFDAYLKKLSNPKDNFYNYLTAHGYTSEVGAFRSFFHKDYNKGRFAYTTPDITLMKIIRGMNCDTPYVVNGKSFKNPQELLTADSSVKPAIDAELSKKDSRLNAWISVFFHEDPFFMIKKTGDYETRLKEFVEFIGKINPNNPLTKRFTEAVDKYQNTVGKEEAIDKRILVGKIIALIIPILTAVALFLYVRTFTANPLPGWFLSVSYYYHLAFVVFTVGFLFLQGISEKDFEFSTIFLGGPILGIILSAVVYYIIMIAISIWPLLAVLLLLLIYIMVKSVIKRKHASTTVTSQLFDSMEFQCVVYEPLVYAFGAQQGFVSSKEDSFKEYRKARRTMKFQILRFCGIPTLLMLTVMYMLYYYNPVNMPTLRPAEYREMLRQDSIRTAEKQKLEKKNAKSAKKTKTNTKK